MGLFFTETGAAARKRTQTPRTPKIGITEAQRQLLTCSQCPLDRETTLRHPKMLPTGADHPILYFLGEAPGANEDELGKQFVGKAGAFLRGYIPSKWIHKIRWNNTLRCRPPKNRDPAYIEIACCRRLQVADIEQTKPKAIVGFGNVPLHWMLGEEDRQISNWRGRRVPVKVGAHTCWFYPITHPSGILRIRDEKKKGAAYLRAFERDLQRVFADAEAGFPDPYVEDPKDYYKGIECLKDYGRQGFDAIEAALGAFYDQEHAIDIETDGLRPYRPDAKILSIAVGTYVSVFAFPWEHPEARWTPRESKAIEELVHDYLLGPGKKWAHSAKFEQEWLHKRYGPDVIYKTEWGDTLLQAHALDERKGKGLDDVTQIHFGFRLKSLSNVDIKNLIRAPLSKVLPYNALDSKYCHAASVVQQEALERDGLVDVYNLLHSATPSLVRMQAKGVVRNPPAIIQLDKELTKQENDIAASIMKNADVVAFMAAGQKFSPTSNPNLVSFFRDFLEIPQPGKQNEASPYHQPTKKREGGSWGPENPHKKNLRERAIMAGEKEKESYSVDEVVLSKLKHPVAQQVLGLRSITKNHGYVTPLLDGGKYVHADGLIHASYSNAVTVSGRLACEDPNQQNYPRRSHKEIRRVVGCPPGHRFVAFDYGQLEWRIGACLSGDKQMAVEIVAGEDIHGVWTDDIGGKFVPKRVKENRKKVRDSIKMFWTFANLYGNLLEGLAWDLSTEFGVDISPRALEPFFTKFWQRYPALKKYQEGLIEKYWRLGYVETATGQRRHEPMARNESINHPFQGTAGHLVINAQERLSLAAYEQDRPQLQPVMNIHDDLSFYLPGATLELDVEDIARYMCTCPFEFVGDVPLMVEVSVGDNWCDKEEIGKFSTEDFT